MNDLKVLYMKGSGKRHMFINHLISQGIDVKVVDSSEVIRGMSCDYVIVDEWVKEWGDENKDIRD